MIPVSSDFLSCCYEIDHHNFTFESNLSFVLDKIKILWFLSVLRCQHHDIAMFGEFFINWKLVLLAFFIILKFFKLFQF